MVQDLADIFVATVFTHHIKSVFNFTTSILYSRSEVLNKLLAAISIIQNDVSLALVNQRFHMRYTFSSNTDQWVDVGLTGQLDRIGCNSSCGTVDNDRDWCSGRAPGRWKTETLVKTKCCSHRS